MIRGVVFDFDGVVIDTEVPEFRAWAAVYGVYGCQLDIAEWAVRIGTRDAFDPYQTLCARATKPVPTESEVYRHKQVITSSWPRPKVLPGVRDWLAQCRALSLPVAIASSSTPEAIAWHLHRVRLRGHFQHIACCDGILRPKPSPDTYLAACHALDVRPSDVLAVEDSPNGVASAKAAGAKCLAVPHALTRSLDLSGADVVIESLADRDVKDILARLGA